MLREFLERASLFFLLHTLDVDLAQTARAVGCSCGGPLHTATFPRKPRGGPPGLPETLSVRLGLCCGWCRQRTLPPSVLFWDRKVYWSVAILVLTTLGQQRTEGYSARRLQRLFGVSRPTLARWIGYFRQVFPLGPTWQRLRGRLLPPVAPEALPGGVIVRFVDARDDPDEALAACLRALRLAPV